MRREGYKYDTYNAEPRLTRGKKDRIPNLRILVGNEFIYIYIYIY